MATYFGFAIADSMIPYGNITKSALSAEDAKEIVERQEIIPCLNPSHIATIEAMRERFDIQVEIPEKPPQVFLEKGDRLIVMSVRGLPRLTDRSQYTVEEIQGASFQFSLYVIS